MPFHAALFKGFKKIAAVLQDFVFWLLILFHICFFICNSKKESVDFSHLMAMGYQHDWFDEQRVQQNQQRQEKEVKIMHVGSINGCPNFWNSNKIWPLLRNVHTNILAIVAVFG